jgi:hypothetical protein
MRASHYFLILFGDTVSIKKYKGKDEDNYNDYNTAIDDRVYLTSKECIEQN